MDFNSLIGLMDKEIALYKQLRQLYSAKKIILIKNDITNLQEVDSKIIKIVDFIKIIGLKRLNITEKKFPNISSLISYAKLKHPQYVEKLEQQRVEIKILAKEINALEKTNIELIKHGIILTDNKLNLIIKLCQSKTTNYSSKGQSESENFVLSTVVQEA